MKKFDIFWHYPDGVQRPIMVCLGKDSFLYVGMRGDIVCGTKILNTLGRIKL